MQTKEFIYESADKAIKSVKADQIEVGIISQEVCTTRFANSIIHQNMVNESDNFWSRVILGKKIGSTSITSIDAHRIKNGMQYAYELAKYQKEDNDFKSLPQAAPIEYIEETEYISPEERASFVEEVIKIANKNNLTAAGVVYTNREIIGIFNSLGIKSVAQIQTASAEITLIGENSTGRATAYTKDFHKINPKELTEIAVEKAIMAKNPIEIEPGKYTVLLEEDAVAEILSFLSWLGFCARRFEEGSSFMVGKIGKKITGDNITIFDDANHKDMIGLPFDFEGIPKEKVYLIENGIAKGIVYDSYYGNKKGIKSTGHALPQPNVWGALPWNIVLAIGKNTKEEMLSSIDEGILVTRFWYTRIIDPDKTLITGMTRDGTFLIKNGKIATGIKNLRFTINILETLSNTLMASDKHKFIEGYFGGGYLVPALLIKDFNFTSKTEY